MAQPDFTIADVLAWARTKPADEWYDYTSPTGCALCCFLSDSGRSAKPLVSPYCDGINEDFGWRTLGEPRTMTRSYPLELEGPLKNGDSTFGGLVTRLEALCPDTVVAPSEWTRLDAYLTDIEAVPVQA